MESDETVWNELRKRHARILGDVQIDCGVGWRDLLDALCAALQRETDLHGAPQAQARQVKEKLRQLRFHAFGLSDTQHGLIVTAVEESYNVCERCGHQGTLRTLTGKLQTMCGNHFTSSK